LVASLPYGSPVVRGALRSAANTILGQLRTLFGYRSLAPLHSQRVTFGRVLSGELAHDYDLSKAMRLFLNAVGAYSFVYLFWHEYNRAPGGELIEGKIAIYDYDRLLREANKF